MKPEDLKCRMEGSHKERGSPEPCLRLHSLDRRPRCARQAAQPREGPRVASQHSYPLHRFSSVPCDPMERPASQADLELDYNPPRVQLSDDMCVFQDGRWVNESCRLQAPYFSPLSSVQHKRPAKGKESLLLQDENRALRDENRALRKENAILQVFCGDHKVSVGHEDSRSSSPPPHKDTASQEGAKEDRTTPPGQRSSENTVQLLRAENRALQQLLEQRRTYWAQAEDKAAAPQDGKPAPSAQEQPHGPGLLADRGPGLSHPFEEPKGPPTPQEDAKTLRVLRETVSGLSGPPGEDEGTAGPAATDGSGQPWQLLREVSQALQALREENRALREENRLLREENRALRVPREERRVLREENKALWENDKLKLQQRLVIDAVTEVMARMEMLIEELYAFMPAKNKEPEKPSRV